MSIRRLVIRTDGAARGNPGPAGAGFVIETSEGEVVDEGAIYLGTRTNNQAEYDALLHALESAALDGRTEVDVYSDSQLLVRQLEGEYRVKNPDLRSRYIAACRMLAKARRADLHHVSRDENAAADALANQAIDAYALEEERA